MKQTNKNEQQDSAIECAVTINRKTRIHYIHITGTLEKKRLE